MAFTSRASQPSLIRSWRADDPAPVSRPTDRPLFDLDLHEATSDRPEQDTARNAQFLQPLTAEDAEEAGRRWANLLKEIHKFQHVAKRVLADFERAGVVVDLRTVQGWCSGRLAQNKHLMAASRIYGAGILAEVFDPTSDEAKTSRSARWKRLMAQAGAA